jgi:hypothetical protein
MAQYEHLPIYKKAYDLTLYFEKVVRGFSRYHKYTLGSELRELSREVLRLIRRANATADRGPLLLQTRERLEEADRASLQRFTSIQQFQFVSIQHQRGGG